MDFAPGAEFLLTGGQDGCLQLWNPNSLAHLASYGSDLQPVWCCEWHPEGHYFVSGSEREALLWSAEKTEPLRIFKAKEVQAMRLHPDGRRVGVADRESLVFWDLSSAYPALVLDHSRSPMATALAASQDGLHWACGFSDGSLALYDFRGGSRRVASAKNPATRRGAHGAAISSAAWAKGESGQDLLFSSSGSNLQVREFATKQGEWNACGEVRHIKLGLNHVLSSLVRPGCLMLLGRA
ncbi:unnamed protein product [Durusdinium trenchii]